VKIYCLSGLGVDHRAFQSIDAENIQLEHIEWIDPLANETLEHYAKRLFKKHDFEDNYNLLGVSFGGMIATEFAKIKTPNRLFLISTIQNRSELRFLYRVAGLLNLHKIAPSGLMKRGNLITNYLFGVKNKVDKELLGEILRDTDSKFLKWALNAILKWENSEKVDNISIHGTKDKILPLLGKVDYQIEGGGHFMIVNRAKDISRILEKEGA
jgi:pimeloyl-ACP methyl ester carboxylesterase